ncbi:uncharacterized protein LOC117650950 isoform X2 [Thrips palmi]|uniref:Uncharacterized protein LOC117650950 isoform X2 n=1 Tax=Thrips palmi TaxID=161013 RepID=A0A6P8ZYL1_THRPL|nr:uncharacterized protein LOC117650950 isoform X2 [Thrips palmi]
MSKSKSASMTASEKEALPASLNKWQRLFTVRDVGHEHRDDERIYRILYFFYAPKYLSLGFAMAVTLNVVDVIMFDADEAARRLPLRNGLACYSALFAHVILTYRKDILLDALYHARLAAVILAKDATPEVKLAFEAAKNRKELFVWRFYPVYSFLMATTASLATLSAPSVVNQILAKQSLLLVGVKNIFDCYMLTSCCASVTVLLTVLVDVHYTCAVLCREIGRRLETQRGVMYTRPVAATYSLVIESARAINTATGHLLPHYVMATFTVPILSTASIVQSPEKADIFDFLSLPLMFLFFGPICEASQSMQNASGAVSSRAYSGPWLDEHAPSRRVRLQIMLQSSARPLCFKVEGLGSLNRPLSRKLATSWFQYLQVLQNLRHN